MPQNRSVGGNFNTASQYVEQYPGGVIPSTTSYAVNTAIQIAPGTAKLTKATAGAYTLPTPNVGDNGTRILVTSVTAAAHTVTCASKLADGVSGSPHSTATFGAFKGASLHVEAQDGLWIVVGLTGVTIA